MQNNSFVESFRESDPELYRELKATERKYSPVSTAVSQDRSFHGKSVQVMTCRCCGCTITGQPADTRVEVSKEKVFIKVLTRDLKTNQQVPVWRMIRPVTAHYYCQKCALPRPDGSVVIRIERGHRLTIEDRLELGLALKGLHEQFGMTMKLYLPRDTAREVDFWAVEFAKKLHVPVVKLPLDAFKELRATEVRLGKPN